VEDGPTQGVSITFLEFEESELGDTTKGKGKKGSPKKGMPRRE